MLSLAGGNTPNASTTSLPGQLQQQQAMGYRKAVSMAASAPTPGAKDPLAVLEGILGVAEAEAGPGMGTEGMPSVEDGMGIEFAGLSLEEFVLANQVEDGEDEGGYSEQSVEECEDSHAHTRTQQG